MSISIVARKLIDLYGQNLTIKRRSISVDEEGSITEDSYSDTISVKGWVTPSRGERELYTIVGQTTQGDYSIVFEGTVSVDVDDRIIFPDGTETEVREIIRHYHKDSVDIKEVIVVIVS